MNVVAEDHIASCDSYLEARTGKYEWRRVRYRAALNALVMLGLNHSSTIMDVGAGWTEFDVCLRTEGGSRCRYIPVDGCIDGTDLEVWTPPRKADFFVALELLEHLHDPGRLVLAMQMAATTGVVISTPNPATTDVLGMDETHKTPIDEALLESWGFVSVPSSFYGQTDDSLFGVWARSR